MQISDLSSQLQQDATNAVPPFGAASIKIARQLGSVATSFLLEQIGGRGATAFLALEALRESDPGAYDSIPASERADIYASALQSNIFYNAWGVPGHQLTSTAYALISLGEVAIEALKPFLVDQRRAPLSGSKDATVSSIYHNRVCDYAWVFICEIRHQPYMYVQNPVERDRSIEALRQELQGNKGA